MQDVEVLIQRLDQGLRLPEFAHPGDAGFDLYASAPAKIAPLGRALIPTGLAIALPVGYMAAVVPRSGLAIRQGVSLVNAPGTVDAGYRGEIQVIAANLDSAATVSFERGDRIAQLIIQQLPSVRLTEVEVLPQSIRGSGGFGSTGR